MLKALAAAAILCTLTISAEARSTTAKPDLANEFCGSYYCGHTAYAPLYNPRSPRKPAESRCSHHGCQEARRSKKPTHDDSVASGGLITINTAAGPVTVSPEFAPKIQGFIQDVVARGFKGPVHCYARGGHIRNSLHYSGNACDFAQRGWGKTTIPMYHVADLALKWGLRDGCTFRDCGHIDIGSRYAGRGHSRIAKL